MANEDSALAGGHSSGLAPFGIGFHFDENNAVEVRKETSGDHRFLIVWTISSIYSPANNLFFDKTEKWPLLGE